MVLLEPHPARTRANVTGTRVLQSADLRTARRTAHIPQPPQSRKFPYAESGRRRRTIRHNTSAGQSNMRFAGLCRESGRTLSHRRRLLKGLASQGHRLPAFRCRAAARASRREPCTDTRCSSNLDGNSSDRRLAQFCGRGCALALLTFGSLRAGSRDSRTSSTIAAPRRVIARNLRATKRCRRVSSAL